MNPGNNSREIRFCCGALLVLGVPLYCGGRYYGDTGAVIWGGAAVLFAVLMLWSDGAFNRRG
jgi:hypothetical protein